MGFCVPLHLQKKKHPLCHGAPKLPAVVGKIGFSHHGPRLNENGREVELDQMSTQRPWAMRKCTQCTLHPL